MVKGVKFRRGTTAEHATFTGQQGEITVDTTKTTAVVHDGTTVGGVPLVGETTTQRIANKDINATALNVTGIVTATAFVGDGSQLTNLPGGGGGGGITTYSSVSGVSTYASTAGIATYASTSGIATYSATSGIATYSSTAGVATVAQGFSGTPNVNVGVLSATSAIIGSGVTITSTGVRASGIITASSFRPSTGYYQSANGTNAFYVFDTSGDVSFQGKIVTNYIRSNTNLNPSITVSDLDLRFARNITVSGITTSTGGFVGDLVGTATSSQGLTGTPNIKVGIVTATSYNGSGVNLTGVITSLVAGESISIIQTSGIATITALLKSRTIVSGVTTSIANNGIGNTNITGFKSYSLMKVGLSTAGWLRLYTDSTSRSNDVFRSVGEDPAPGSGVIAEVVTTGISTTQIISPFVMGGNLNDPADTTIYAAITNLSGSTQAITANLTILQLEA